MGTNCIWELWIFKLLLERRSDIVGCDTSYHMCSSNNHIITTVAYKVVPHIISMNRIQRNIEPPSVSSRDVVLSRYIPKGSSSMGSRRRRGKRT